MYYPHDPYHGAVVLGAVHSNSSDTESSSTPITPVSMPDMELMYPDNNDYSHGVDFSSFHPPFPGEFDLHHNWSSADMDTTPTEPSETRGKSPSQPNV